MKKNDSKVQDIQNQIEELEKREKVKKTKPSEIEILKQELEISKQKCMRAMADYQNLERRVEKDKIDWIKMANAELLLKMLQIADDLDRAAGFINDAGLNMVRDNLQKLLFEYGIEEIKAEGQQFDHDCMECIEQREGQANLVLAVSAKGYKLNGRILRPAKVVVGK